MSRPTPAQKSTDEPAVTVDQVDELAPDQVDEVAPADAPALVGEGTRQELLAGARAFDYASGRELTLDGAGPDSPGRVRFKTAAEIAADPPPGQISTADVATLNPT